MPQIGVETEGVAELVDFMSTLGERLERKHIRQSLNKAANVILKEQRRILVSDLPAFKKNALKKRGIASRGKFTVVNMGNVKKPGGRLVPIFELGTKDRTTTAGASRGRIRPHRFLARGFDIKAKESQRLLGAELKKRIEQEWALRKV